MQKVLTAEQMRTVDRLTTERYGIASILLMENAAHAVAAIISERLSGSVKGKPVLVLCGRGNNGGDGAAIARILWKEGASVVPLLFGRVSETAGDARTNFEILKKFEDEAAIAGGEFNKLILHESDEDLIFQVEGFLNAAEPKIVVDALFGTGLTRELSGIYVDVIQRLENHRPQIVSVDIPSGLNADLSEPIGRNITATATVTFTAPKLANVAATSSHFNGELTVANIGSPQELVDDQLSETFVSEGSDARQWLKFTQFAPESYKNKRGHAVLIAGSDSYTGAAVLAGDAAMRSGVGLVTVATPRSSKDSVASRVLPEIIVRGVAETDSGAVSEAAFDELHDLFDKADAVAVGSGLSQDDGTRKFVQNVIEKRRCPTVVDADALNLVSPFKGEALGCMSGSAVILTPHEGEFMRLLGTTAKDAIKDRIANVRNFAREHNVVLVLKGERVLIGAPDGRVVVNPTGNSGLGKAGNGDTLTGILAGFTAQAAALNIDIFEAVVAAVYVAGMAGDVAERKFGKRVMTATDVRECLADVFASLGERG